MTIENLKEGDLEINVDVNDALITLTWRGSIHSQNPEDYLDLFLADVLKKALVNKSKVICDFYDLQYMNSSTIPPLIQFIRQLSEEKLEGEYIYDSKRKIQAASFKALKVVASKSNLVKIVGK